MGTTRDLLTALVLAVTAVLAGCACVAPPAPAGAPAPPAPAAAEPSRVVVSYFHGSVRCETCLRFEALSDRALREAFPAQLAAGRVAWRVMDFEEPGHEVEVARYDVFESSLVVSRFVGDAEVEWKKLDAIWGLTTDDGAFVAYVRSEVDAYLNARPVPGGARGGSE